MHKLKSWALVALAAFGLTARGAVSTNDWWTVNFESPTTNGVYLIPAGETFGSLTTLTNKDDDSTGVVQPYNTGVWYMHEGDESYVTNQFEAVTTNSYAFGYDACLKLDTQGNDLTWSNEVAAADNLKALVDADLYLVGSDSAPDISDFDAGHDVQTAIYLKNEIDEGTGETSNSVLCVYVQNDMGGSYWQELDGVELDDSNWAHVQVIVDHSTGDIPLVQVFVNGTKMHARDDAGTDEWEAANGSNSKDAKRVSSVAFRGTGAVDNFVGQTVLNDPDKYDFTAEVYKDGKLVTVTSASFPNATQTKEKVAVGNPLTFDAMILSDYDYVSYETNATWALKRVEIIDPAGSTTTVDCEWDTNTCSVVTNDFCEALFIATDDEFGFQTGEFTVTAPTAGATNDMVLVRVYFQTLGAYDAYATTDLGGTVSTNATVLKPVAAGGTYPTNLVWTFPAVDGGNILSTILVTNGASFAYSTATSNATVSVTVNAALEDNTIFAAAVYTNGTLEAGQTLAPDEGVNGLYTFSVTGGGSSGEEHTGAKSDEGFVILDPTDSEAAGKQLEFTDFDPSTGTAVIEAAILNPNGASSVTLQLIYRTSLTGADQYVDATISDIDTTTGTATVTFTPPANEDTVFLIGFRNKTGIVDP